MFANFTILTQCVCQWSFSKCIEDQVRPHVQCISPHLLSFSSRHDGLLRSEIMWPRDSHAGDRAGFEELLRGSRKSRVELRTLRKRFDHRSFSDWGRQVGRQLRAQSLLCVFGPRQWQQRGPQQKMAIYILKTALIEVYVQMFYISIAIMLQIRCITHVVIRLLLCLPFFFCFPLNTAVLLTVLQTHFLARTMARRLEASIWKWFTESTRMPPSPPQRLRVLLWDS